MKLPVAIGTDGIVSAFSKIFGNQQLAVQTQFHIAESYFELFKNNLKLERDAESEQALKAGRRVLQEIMVDYPDPKYLPRIAYLSGQFSQELEDWNEAANSYVLIVRQYPNHTLAADANTSWRNATRRPMTSTARWRNTSRWRRLIRRVR